MPSEPKGGEVWEHGIVVRAVPIMWDGWLKDELCKSRIWFDIILGIAYNEIETFV